MQHPDVTLEQRVAVLRDLAELLRDVSLLREEADKEDKAMSLRKHPEWTAHEAFSAKMDELREYLSPTGEQGGCYLIPLHPKYNHDEQCYSIVYD